MPYIHENLKHHQSGRTANRGFKRKACRSLRQSCERIIAFLLSFMLTMGMTVAAAAVEIPGTGTGCEVIAFEALPDSIRLQSVENGTASDELSLPAMLAATTEGGRTEVPVTWRAEPDYDGNTKGLYIFTAVPDEGWSCTAEPPEIVVVVRAAKQRFSLFAFGGGAQASDPFLISTAKQLSAIAGIVNEGSLETLFLGENASGQVFLKLENDIDLSGYGAGEGWVPIGREDDGDFEEHAFRGDFDGDGHLITGLKINRAAADYQGLFGVVGEGGVVRNLGIDNGDITGKDYLGTVAGAVYSSTIENCFSTVRLSGGSFTGGIAGMVREGLVQNCHSAGDMSGGSNVGGIAGFVADGTVQNCYSTGSVTGTGSNVGGVTGHVDSNGAVQNCAALNSDVNGVSGVGRIAGQLSANALLDGNIAFRGLRVLENNALQNITDGAAGNRNGLDKSASDIKAESFFESLFSNEGAWTYETGFLPGFGAAIEMPAHILDKEGREFLGEGTIEEPYEIHTAEELARLSELVRGGIGTYGLKHYILMNDVDLSGYRANGGWKPISLFSGVFDGNGNTITGLYINRPEEIYQGLFGWICTDSTAVVKNLNIMNADITGINYVGGVAGRLDADCIIQNCRITGSVSGRTYVGGIAGQVALSGTIEDCSNCSSVTGTENYVGGIAGDHSSGTMQNCLNTGNISGVSYVGGIAGQSNGTIQGCSNSGNITGTDRFAGGIAGTIHIVRNCSNTGSVNGEDYIGGIAGASQSIYGTEMDNCFSTGSIVGIDRVGGLTGYIELNGSVRNCAALNSEIKGTSELGRISGSLDPDTANLINNIAFSGMKVNESVVAGGAGNNQNGADAAAADIMNDAGGMISGRFTSENGWTYTAGGLPVLTGLDGQDATLPSYISGRYFGGGDGSSEEQAYEISTAAQLVKLAELVNDTATYPAYRDRYYKLTRDIDLSGIDPMGDGTGWVPIGNNYDRPFRGHFLGNGKVISGLCINRPEQEVQGFFGFVAGIVKDLGIVDADIKGSSVVAGVAAYLRYSNNITNCYTTGNITGVHYVGGIAGYLEVYRVIRDCYSTANVSGTGNYIGGIAGYADDYCLFLKCYSTGNVTGRDYVGGILGADRYYPVEIVDCYSTGIINGANHVGGIIGRGKYLYMGRCYSLASVSGSSGIGGLEGTGEYNNIYDCVALNAGVSGMNNAGRIVGIAYEAVLLTNNYAYSGLACENKGDSFYDGLDLPYSQLLDVEFWKNNVHFSEEDWILEDGKLPILKDLAGQSAIPDMHLISFSTSPLTISLDSPCIMEDNGSISALASRDTQAVSVTVAGWENWTAPGVTITARKTETMDIIPVTPGGNGAGSFDIPADFNGEITIIAASVSKPGNKTEIVLIVNKRDLTIADFAYDLSIPPVYNGSAQPLSVTVSEGTGTVSVQYNGMEAPPVNAGVYAVTAHYPGDGVYNATADSGVYLGDYIIDRKPVIITPDAGQGKTYGQVDPVLAYTISEDLFGSDTFTGALARDAGEDVGSYAIGLGDLSAGNNYAPSLSGAASFAITQATVQSIDTIVNDVAMTAFEVRNTSSAEQVLGLASLPASLSVTTDGGTAMLPVTWETSTAYDSKGAAYAVTGTLQGNDNINSDGRTCSITLRVTPVAITNPVFEEAFVVRNNDAAATAQELGESILPTGGSIPVEGASIAYAISWNSEQDLDRTTAGATQTFTGTVSYTNPPEWLTLPDDFTVSRKVTVTGGGNTGGDSGDSGDNGGEGGGGGNGGNNADTGGEGGSGSNEGNNADAGGNSGEETQTQPDYRADISNGETLPVSLNNHHATVSLDEQHGAELIPGGALAVAVPTMPGVERYSFDIPMACLTVPDGNGTITFQTAIGQIVVPTNMFSGIADGAGKAELTVANADRSELPEHLKAAIGERPILEISVAVDGQTVAWSNPEAPVRVSVPYVPTAEELANPENIIIWYIDGNGNPICVPNGHYDPVTGTVTFTTTHFSLFAVAWNAVAFNDITADAWYSKAVGYIAARGITRGTGNGHYNPSAKLTRGEFIVLVMRAYGIAPDTNAADNFSDAGSTYYTGYLAAAKRLGITAGTGNNMYSPDKEITRQEMFTLLVNTLRATHQIPSGSTGRKLSDFSDAGLIRPWAEEAMALLVKAGAIKGNAGKLLPADTTTRAEMAQVLHNLLTNR